MILKLFLFYLGGLFLGAMAMFGIVKRFAGKFGKAGLKPLLYSIVVSLISGLLMFGLSFLISNLFILFWIFVFLFLGLSVLHRHLTHEKYFVEKGVELNKLMSGELLFVVEIVLLTLLLFSASQYFLLDKNFLFYPVLCSSLSMFIPYFIIYTFEKAWSIPSSNYPTWMYPVKPIEVPDDNSNERLLVIGFMIAKKNHDTTKTYFRAKTPENIKLGELFYHFINDYNDLQSETPIEYVDEYKEAVEWWYHRKPKWYQLRKILDPNLTMIENNVKENTVIICERILSV